MLVVAILGDSRAVQMQTDDLQIRWVREIVRERERTFLAATSSPALSSSVLLLSSGSGEYMQTAGDKPG